MVGKQMMHGKQTHKILLADSHVLFRRGLRTLLAAESDMEVIGEASNASEALSQAQELLPDALVMDLALVNQAEGSSPLQIRQLNSATGLLFLTHDDSPAQLELAIAAGARGYMLRNSASAELLAGIRQIATSENQQQPNSLSRIMPDLQALAGSSEYPRASVLTVREQEVVRLLAEGRTVREVAAELSLSIKTIEAHKLNLMRKLDIHNRTTLIQYAVQAGLMPAQHASVQP
ncbi:MAG TPA: response regulator transcription factor [Bryobacteraceae bacterium]|nr:response regulator transcription factor [Bryobacteraceae bacterium]